MGFLILMAILFCCGLGIVFEIFGFLFRLIFSGVGLFFGAIVAAVLTVVFLPAILAIFGIVLPKAFIVIGVIALVIMVSRKGNRGRNDYSDRDYSQNW